MKKVGKGRTAIRRVAIAAVIPMFAFFGYRTLAQTDLPLARSHLDDSKIHDFTNRKPVLRLALSVGILELRNVTESFDSLFDFNKYRMERAVRFFP